MTDPTVARVLLQAASTARGLRGRTRVVKFGGSAMEDPAATRGTIDAIVALQTLGVRQIVVHGGGKAIDRAMAAANLTVQKVQGRRTTDAATLEIVVRILRKEICPGVVKHLQSQGGAAVGLHGDDRQILFGEKLTLPGTDGKPVDLGFVGNPSDVDSDLLDDTLDEGMIPVIPSLAVDSEGGWLNVNADTAAAAVAGAVQAEAVLFLTDTPGVLRDRANPASLLPRLTESEARSLIANGVIEGGMVPKVEACFTALAAGAARAVILDGRDPNALLAEFLGAPPAGTEIAKD
ncbi:MAG TPA: acetylglutamate kinase [Fimbriiglobus sp.]|jgi:acetylglutamate kinase